MRRWGCILMIAGSLVWGAHARSWTTRHGKTVEAKVVRVNANQTVVLKTTSGKTVAVPFNTFVDEDIQHLEALLARRKSGRGKLHPVPWDELNQLFGIKIWTDDFLWDDPTAEVAERMEMQKESKTAFMENYRAYPLGKQKILSEPVYTLALYGGKEHAESLSMVFLNQGDQPVDGSRVSPKKIKASGLHVRDVLQPLLGKPTRDSLGSGKLREKVWRWDWNGHAIMLSLQEGKYAALRIMPIERAERGGRAEKVNDDELRARMATCIERRDNGDAVVCNIPMVDQGPKGYCVPATWERYLRYLDIPADMYLLALAADTGIGGGTSTREMVGAARSVVSSNGRKLKELKPPPSMDTISRYIDMGLPIMWTLKTTPEFRKAIYETTARRKGEEPQKKNYGSSTGGHICLIIGYNRQRGEVATSDSWGAEYTERWVPLRDLQNATLGTLCVIRW